MASLSSEAPDVPTAWVYGIADQALPRGVELSDLLRATELLSERLRAWALKVSWAGEWARPSATEAVLPVFHGSRQDMLGWTEGLKKDLHSDLGRDVSFGIGASRTVARLCARVARPRGILFWEPGFERGLMSAIPLEELDELGESHLSRLRAAGVRTVLDLAQLEQEKAHELLGPAARSIRARVQLAAGGATEQGPSWLMDLVERLALRLSRKNAWARGVELEVGYRNGVRDLRYHRLTKPSRRGEKLLPVVERLAQDLPSRREAPMGVRLTATGVYCHGQLPLVGAIVSDISVYRGSS